MRPRSVIFDVYGQYLRHRGSEASLQQLSRLLGCFGILPATVRVTLTRMRSEGWLRSRRLGRSSLYALTDRAITLLNEGQARIFHRRTAPWCGSWQMVVHPAAEASRRDRESVRRQLAWLGFAQLAADTWIAPDPRRADTLSSLPRRLPGAAVFSARSSGLAADRLLAARCWDLARIDAGYREFVRRHAPAPPGCEGPPGEGSHGFVERTRLVNEYRRFPFQDPDLPHELLPPSWAGHDAHALFLRLYQELREPAWSYVDAVLETSARDRTLPDDV